MYYCQYHPQTELVEKKNRLRGNMFWGCPLYPDCRFVMNPPQTLPDGVKNIPPSEPSEVLNLRSLEERVVSVEQAIPQVKQEILDAISDVKRGINYLLDSSIAEKEKLAKVNSELQVVAEDAKRKAQL